MKKNVKVMVFGVFDRLHSGHRAFLRQAKKHGKKLMVVIAHDSSVLKLKKKRPWQSERQRMVAIRKSVEFQKPFSATKNRVLIRLSKNINPISFILATTKHGLQKIYAHTCGEEKFCIYGL